MKNVKSRLAAAWSRVPAVVKTQAAHVVLTFVVAFVAVAAPAVPSLYAAVQLGSLPSLSVIHALVVAAFAAALKATIPTVRAGAVASVSGIYHGLKGRQAARLQRAVEAYLVIKAAAQVAETAKAQETTQAVVNAAVLQAPTQAGWAEPVGQVAVPDAVAPVVGVTD